MELKHALSFLSQANRQKLAHLANTSVGNLYQIAGKHRSAGPALAIKIEEVAC